MTSISLLLRRVRSAAIVWSALFASVYPAIASPADYALLEARVKRDIAAVRKALDEGANVNAATISGKTALMWAATVGYAPIVRLLIEKGAKREIKDDKGKTALDYAREQNAADIVQLLSGQKSNLADILDLGDSPQSSAAQKPSPTPDGGPDQALLAAAARGDAAAISRALAAGANINATDKTPYQRTPLIKAIASGDDASVRLLIESGADVDLDDADGITPLMWAASVGNRPALELLFAAGADPMLRTVNGGPIVRAIENKHADLVPVLLKGGANPNERTMLLGETPLLLAIQQGLPDTIKLLLQNGADPAIKDAFGGTTSALARKKGDPAVIAALRTPRGQRPPVTRPAKSGSMTARNAATTRPVTPPTDLRPAPPTVTTSDKVLKVPEYAKPTKDETPFDEDPHNTPMGTLIRLMYDPAKCDTGNDETLKSFVQQAKPGRFDSAAKHDDPEAIATLFQMMRVRRDSARRASANDIQLRDLLRGGVNPNARDRFGSTPLMWAASNDDYYAAATLLNDGADVNAVNPDGMTALMAAVLWDKELIVRLLLERGARKDTKDKKGRTAYSLAMSREASLILTSGCKLKP